MVQERVRLPLLFLNLKINTMTTAKLSAEAKDMLVGRTIYSAGDNWIKLDNGLVIYLDDSEIEHLN
jgi:hypothetical protein